MIERNCDRILLKIRKDHIENCLLFVSFFLLEINYLMYQTLNAAAWKLPMRIVAIGVLLLFLLQKSHSIKMDFLTIGYAILTLLVFVFSESRDVNFLVILVAAIACVQITTSMLIRFAVVSSSWVFAIYGVLLLAGMIQPYRYLAQDGRIRNTLGFSNVNAAAMFFFSWAILIIILLYYKKRKIGLGSLVVTAFVLWISKITGTRTILMAFVIFIFLNLIFHLLSRHKMISAVAVNMICLACAVWPVASVLLGVNGDRLPALDRLVSYRLSIARSYLNHFTMRTWLAGSSIFGEVDNVFLVFIAKYGAIMGILAVIFVVRAVKKLLSDGSWLQVSFVLVFWIIGAVEATIIRPELIVSIVFWGIVFKNSVEFQKTVPMYRTCGAVR